MIKIMSLMDVVGLVTKNMVPPNTMLVSIRDTSGGFTSLYEYLDSKEEVFRKIIVSQMDDIMTSGVDIEGKMGPTDNSVADILLKAGISGDVIVHCTGGISRSSAIAYLIACRRTGKPTEAIKILNPKIHWPNDTIVKIGAKIFGDEEIKHTYDRWRERIMVEGEMMIKFEDSESNG